MKIFSKEEYAKRLGEIFVRFPSVQKAPFGEAYKPGLEHIREFDRRLGFPSKAFRSIHVAGTNGKGSVASMMTAVLAASGMRTGLYTSPHIHDFRERARIAGLGGSLSLVSEEYVWDFLNEWEDTFEELGLSFFEITTGLAFRWFADMGADVAVIETGLGGRLDSTNIITPDISIITSIGLDHCGLLGNTLAEITSEKAGIMKKGVPAVIGTRDPETAPVFIARAEGFCPLTFADSLYSPSHPLVEEIFSGMDLRGEYQKMNLATVLASADTLETMPYYKNIKDNLIPSLRRTAALTGFHGRWEKAASDPDIILDIGHNPPALEKNFAQLEEYLRSGEYSGIKVIYGVMADKDLASIIPLMPRQAKYLFVTPDTARALPSCAILERFLSWFGEQGLPAPDAKDAGTVARAMELAVNEAAEDGRNGGKTLIYIGGSTFAVAEASALLHGPADN